MKQSQTRRGDHPRVKELGGVHAKIKNGKSVHLGLSEAENVQKSKNGKVCNVAANPRLKSKMKKTKEKPHDALNKRGRRKGRKKEEKSQVPHSESESSATCA